MFGGATIAIRQEALAKGGGVPVAVGLRTGLRHFDVDGQRAEVHSGSGQHDAVKCERLRKASEVSVAMQDGEAAVLAGRSGDQRVSERYAVIAIAALGELGQSPHRGVCDGAVVADDAQRVQFGFKRDVLETGARRVQDLHSNDWRDPQAIIADRMLHERCEIVR